ncbi:copper-containing amine oxidase, partial [Arthrobacter globiformis NBRC 12137]
MTLDIETSAAVGVAHPLDPLSREEISRAVAVLKEGPAAAESFRFISVELREPAKEDLRNGVQVGREADAVLVDRAAARSYEAVVNLETGTVEKWVQL